MGVNGIVLNAAILLAAGAACGGNDGVVNRGPYDDPITKLSRLDTSTFIEIMEVRASSDGTVYFCSGVKGLSIVDATKPSKLRTRQTLTPSSGSRQYPKCQHLTVAGSWLYMSNRGDETQPTPFVTAFDLSRSPAVEAGTFFGGGETFEGLASAGTLVYATMHESGLAVLENRDNQLLELGRVDGLTNAWAVAVRGERAYVADGTGGLAVIDISNSAQPVLLGRAEFPGAAIHIELDATRDFAYVSAGQGGVVVVDLSDDATPVVVATADTPGTALQVAVDGNVAWVADWNDIRAYEISDPTAPRLLATDGVESSDDFPRVLGIGAADGVAYVGEWTGFYAYELHAERSAPDIWLAQRAVEFPQISANQVDAVALFVRNEGSEPLVVDSIELSGDAFSIDASSLTVAPGETGVLELSFAPGSDAVQSGSLELRSDDPDEGVVRLDLLGNRAGLGVGDLSPDVTVDLLEGGTWKLSDELGQVVVLAYFATF